MAQEKKSKLNREILAVAILVAALLVALSLLSYNPRDRSLNTPSGSLATHNWGGPAGAYLADLLLQALGLSSYLLPLFLFTLSYGLFRDSYDGTRPTKLVGGLLLVWSAATFLSLVRVVDAGRETGGLIGDLTAQFLAGLFGRVGAYVIVLPTLLLSIAAVSQKSLIHLFERGHKQIGKLNQWTASSFDRLKKSWRERKERGENKKKEQREFIPPPIVLKEDIKEEPAKRAKKKSPPRETQLDFPEIGDGQGYKLPPLDLLDAPDGEHVRLDKETLEANSLILQNKLADFGVEGEVVAVKPGPVITMYEFKPAPGVKVRRIVTLADDLSMALRAMSIRILAPIPGESVVGIEIPNPRREKVFFRQVIESDLYQNADSKLTLALGRDISGAPFIGDLARMPHLLVAGATGTGKSVSINAMILSMLYKASPQDLQFIMIDPKMLELSIYENLPHMIVPVVTDAKKAAAALFWAMDEMDRRYRLMRDKGAKNIDHYNRLVEKDAAEKRKVIDLNEGENPPEETGGDLSETPPLVHERLPRVVIVVDELADLMMTVGRDIEEYITRLAQKARASGIHMILATQRPSVDVITGLIKANFPARISFQVTSRVDSRTILDSIGAERLLGDGDMLFLPPGTARLSRVHGAYVSDHEIRKVMDFITQQAKPHYRLDVFEAKKEIESTDGEEEYDEMYDSAVELVTETQQASISMIQRRLRVGYNRAARMIEQMERDGVVGPADGAKPREVYARKIET
ncbi:MAG: DNA translocase FtsK 4TM domain-containing protein [Candidatus Binatia bacterium]